MAAPGSAIGHPTRRLTLAEKLSSAPVACVRPTLAEKLARAPISVSAHGVAFPSLADGAPPRTAAAVLPPFPREEHPEAPRRGGRWRSVFALAASVALVFSSTAYGVALTADAPVDAPAESVVPAVPPTENASASPSALPQASDAPVPATPPTDAAATESGPVVGEASPAPVTATPLPSAASRITGQGRCSAVPARQVGQEAAGGDRDPFASGQEMFADLTLNGHAAGNVYVFLSASDLFLLVDDLDKARVVNLHSTRVPHRGQIFASLGSACGTVWSFDPHQSTLFVTLPATAFEVVTLDGSNRLDDKEVPLSHDREAHANYSIEEAGGHTVAVGGVTATALGGIVRLSDASGIGSGALGADITYDNPAKGRSLVVGTTSIVGGATGGSPRILGAMYRSDDSLQPYVYHHAMPTITGLAASDATASLYVNGSLVQTYTVGAGPFALHNIPLTAAEGTAQVVVTDALGQHVYKAAFETEGDILYKGTRDFQFGIGRVLRNDAFLSQPGGGIVAGRERVGISDNTTAGLRFEALSGVINGSGSLDAWNQIGAFHLVGGMSDTHGVHGTAWEAGWEKTISNRTTVGFSAAGQSPTYVNSTQSLLQDRAISQTSGLVHTNIGKVDLGLAVSRHRYREAGSEDGMQMTISGNVNRALSLFGEVASSNYRSASVKGRSMSIFLGANFSLPGERLFHMGASRISDPSQPGGTVAQRSVGLTQTMAPAGGLAYDANYGQGSIFGNVQYGSQFGTLRLDRYEGARPRLSDSVVTFSGSLIATHRIVAFGPPLTDGYALVDVGLAGVPIFANGQYAGKTRADGLLVVPATSTILTQVAASLENAPRNVDLVSTDARLRVRRGSGALVVRKATLVRAVSGRFVFPDGSGTPLMGDAVARRGDVGTQSIIGVNGSFYFENLPAGTWDVDVAWRNGSCTAKIESPRKAALVTDLGAVTCIPKSR